MNFTKKIIISIAMVSCVLSLMATGVYSAITATIFGISNNVTFIPSLKDDGIKVRFYKIDPRETPSLNASFTTKSLTGNVIVYLEESKHENYKFLGWYTYDFDTLDYGSSPYEIGDVIIDSDLDDENRLFLFDKHLYTFTLGTGGNASNSQYIDEFGVNIKVDKNNGIVHAPTVESGKTDVVIPSSVYVEGVGEVPITSIEQNWQTATGNEWSGITSIKFQEPSNIKQILYTGMGELDEIKSMILPSSLEIIINQGLSGLGNIEWIVVPQSVKELRYHGFSDVNPDCKVYCEIPAKPSGWNNQWMSLVGGRPMNQNNIYWGIGVEWDYVDGVPTPLVEK